MISDNSEVLNAILRTDLSSFINKVFNTINPGIIYKPNWHIELISEYLKEVQRGNIKRLIINIPPRSLKSVCISVAWPAWILGHNPSARILVASYAQSLSIKHSLDTRMILESDWFKQLYSSTILSKKHNLKTKFMTTSHGFRLATSVGGSVTGEGGDILIIDDPHNPTHIHSTKIRNKAIDWYEQTFSTRLNDTNKGVILLVMQRLHIDDLSGYLISKKGNWEMLKIPAIANKDMLYNVGSKAFFMKNGSVLNESRDSIQNYKTLEMDIGKYNFAAQYLQSPNSKSEGLVDSNLINYYDQEPKDYDFIVQSWDSAVKVNFNSDYTVGTVWGIKGNLCYLLDLIRGKFTYPQLKNVVTQELQKLQSKYVLIEDKASGQSLIQDLKANGFTNVIARKAVLDKVTRFVTIVPYIESGTVLFPKFKPWLSTVLSEMSNFPQGDNDDIVDSISQFLNFIREKDLRKTIPRVRNI